MSQSFGENLKRIREKNGWTLEEMAERLDSTKQVLSRYERGERTPKITMAARFAEKLGVPLRDLVGQDADKKWDLNLQLFGESNTPKTQEARIISGGVDKMPKEKREQALQILKIAFAEFSDLFKEDNNDET